MREIIFITVFLSIYGGINWYLYSRLWILTPYPSFRPYILTAFIVSALAFPLTSLVMAWLDVSFLTAVKTFGGFHFAFMLYFFLVAFSIDILSLMLPSLKENFSPIVSIILLIILVVVLPVAGYQRAVTPVITRYSLTIPAYGAEAGTMKVALWSDIHLNATTPRGYAGRLVDMTMREKPDMILVAGDLIDRSIDEVERRPFLQELTRLHAPMGVYGVTGNHDLFDDPERAVGYFEKAGITVMDDRSLVVDDRLEVVGRRDRAISYVGGSRKELVDIVPAIKKYPRILLDHTPSVRDAEAHGVDIQVSGHTHQGQMWPASVVTSLMFVEDYGVRRLGETWYVVSSGAGTWGPMMRIGTKSEVVLLEITLQKTD